jgi:hypothetical protein
VHPILFSAVLREPAARAHSFPQGSDQWRAKIIRIGER